MTRRMVKHRYVVNLRGGEGEFAGVLTSAGRRMFVFEQCTTVPKNFKEGTPADIPGRVFVERCQISYLQQIQP